MATIKINIPFRIVSKKNHRRNFGHTSLPSVAYENFKSLCAEYLLPYASQTITTPFRIDVCYRMKGKYHSDIDNCITSLLDVLQDYQIITDDDLCVEVHGVKTSGNKEWLCEIELAVI